MLYEKEGERMSLQRTPTKTKTVRVFDKREDIIGYVTPLAATKLINAGVAKKWDDRVNEIGRAHV